MAIVMIFSLFRKKFNGPSQTFSCLDGVEKVYQAMLRKLGPEFPILREIPLEEIEGISGKLVAEGISRLRRGEVTWRPGFDGEYCRNTGWLYPSYF